MITRSRYIYNLVSEALNRGEKIVLGTAAAGIIGHHLANKYGIDIGHHLGKAHDTVKHTISHLSGSHNGDTTTTRSHYSSSSVETPETRPTLRVETHYDQHGNVTGETHHSELGDGTPVRHYKKIVPEKPEIPDLDAGKRQRRWEA